MNSPKPFLKTSIAHHNGWQHFFSPTRLNKEWVERHGHAHASLRRYEPNQVRRVLLSLSHATDAPSDHDSFYPLPQWLVVVDALFTERPFEER